MNMKYLLVTLASLLVSSLAFAHPGHEHEIGMLAGFVHAIANNGLWLFLFLVVGGLVGYRMVR